MRYRVPESFRDADRARLSPELLAQIKLSALLGYGFVLSLRGIGGLASLAAVVIGLVEARRRIRRSGGRLAGVRLAWWCIIFGGFWAVVLPLLVASQLLRW